MRPADGPGTRVLVFGVERSGTTWTAAILGATRAARLFSEPDIAYAGPHAMKAMAGRGHALVLGPGDRAPKGVEQLWRALLAREPARRVRGRNVVAHPLYDRVPIDERLAVWEAGGRRGSWRLRAAVALSQPPRVGPHERVVVKTVVSALAVEWMIDRWQPHAVWVRRHPLDVVASRRETDKDVRMVPHVARAMEAAGMWPQWCPGPPSPEDPLACHAWYAGLVMSWCLDVAARRPCLVVDHEALCADPVARFRDLASRVGLEWDDAAAARIEALNTPGAAWQPQRVTAAQPGKWRRRLAADEVDHVVGILRPFPIAEVYDLA